ncbi:MAG: hypothetical protein ABL931_15960 [Usitatibacteraceae bacterium]
MKKTALFIFSGASALALGGCATWPSEPGYVEVTDYQKIELVERWARNNNTNVIWITAPTRKVPVTGS